MPARKDEVEKVDIIFAGTSCKCASSLNMHRGKMLNQITSGRGSTSSTFVGLLQARCFAYAYGAGCSVQLVVVCPCFALHPCSRASGEVVQLMSDTCRLVLLENVVGLATPDAGGRSNLDAVRACFDAIGQLGRPRRTCSRQLPYGTVPQHVD